MADSKSKTYRVYALASGVVVSLIAAGVIFFAPADKCVSPDEGVGEHQFLSKENPWFSSCGANVYALLDEKTPELKFTFIPNESPENFRVLSSSFALGKQGVYYISKGDLFGNSLYLMSDIDPETFSVDDNRHAHDAKSSYYISGEHVVVSSLTDPSKEKITLTAKLID